MGDGSRTDRIVTAPAKKATGYGKQAAATTAEVALGEVAEAVWNAIIDHVGLRAAARDAPAPLWVGAARNLWVGLARTEPSLKPVVIADLAWYAGFASALAAKPAIAELDGLYGAWTNSSTLVLVSNQIFGLGPEVARILLRHEAQHVISFRANGDRPPVSYAAMATFERDAYT